MAKITRDDCSGDDEDGSELAPVSCSDTSNLAGLLCGDPHAIGLPPGGPAVLVPINPIDRAFAGAAEGKAGEGGGGAEAGETRQGSRRLPFTDADRVSEINKTLDRIESGTPKYLQDGTVYENRNGALPTKPYGHYQEWTVDTPGAKNRGVRRIVRGADGEAYYTGHHYDKGTWVQIDPTRY